METPAEPGIRAAMPPRQPLLLLMLLMLLLQLPAPSSANIVNCGFCVCERASITCDFASAKDRIKDSFTLEQFVPKVAELRDLGLEASNFEDIYINCKNAAPLQNQRLTRALLSSLVKVKKVAIVRCDLTAIDADALHSLSNLQEFDASDNNLQEIPPGLFNSLNMTLVKLSENKRLQLGPRSFLGLSLQRLILTRCELAEFPTEALYHIKDLRELTMSENRIRYLPSSSLALVRKLRIFYLDDNPLACTCINRWLRESISWEVLSPSVMRKSKLPTCKSPFNLMDIELTKVEPSRFLCPPPRITSVDVSLRQDSALLACTAEADDEVSSHQKPLSWFYRSSADSPAAAAAAAASATERGRHFSRLLPRTPGQDAELFQLRVASSDGQSTSFNLTVAWPPLEAGGGGGGGGGGASATAESPVLPEKPPGGPHQAGGYYGQKQFTLVEMIIAVIGTFMATSLVFLLSCQFVRWYKRRDKKRWATYAGGQQHQQYSATYNYNPHGGGQASSHEYDVPRIDQPCLPKPPPPPATSLLPPQAPLPLQPGGGSSVSSSDREFLDYNNPRLMYNV